MISKKFQINSPSRLSLNLIQSIAKKEVEDKIKHREYNFEQINCPICNIEESQLLSQKDRYGLEYSVVVCENCGLIYVNPRMDQDSYNKFYDLEYRRLYLGSLKPSEYYFERQYKRGKTIFNFINDINPKESLKGKNILEVGCSAGGILLFFKNMGCHVFGVDLDTGYLNYGVENYGMNLINGSLKDVPNDFKPDIIIYSHVFEHILDVNKELDLLKKKCTANTIVYIEVPGIKNVHNAYNMDLLQYFQNAHTFHFSLTSLTNLLNKNNFTLIKGDEFIRSAFALEIKTNYLQPQNDYKSVMNYILKIEKYRFLNRFKLKNLGMNSASFIKKTTIKIIKRLGFKNFVKRLYTKH